MLTYTSGIAGTRLYQRARQHGCAWVVAAPAVRAALLATVFLAGGRIALGQPLSFAVVGGPAAATMADFRDTGAGSALQRRAGVVAGGSFELPVGARLSVLPEALYAQKGIGVDAPAAPGSPARVLVFERFDYLEMPLLLRIGAVGGRRGIYGVAGPMVAWLVRARERFEGPGIPIADQDLMDDVAHVDAGAVLGGGVSAGPIDVELRADVGLRTLIPAADRRPGDPEPKNRSVAALVRWRL